MTRLTPKILAAAATVGLVAMTTPATAQSAMTPAQCEAMMMAGTQNYSATAVAGCTAYFQTLARNAAAPGAFSASTSAGVIVNASSSGSGG